MHIFDNVTKILTSNSSDLKEIAKLVGSNPKHFYRHQDLSDCDLRGQDLTGMDLTGTNVERSRYDESTKFDPEFDPRLNIDEEYITIRISTDLNTMILAFAEVKGYTYLAWAYKYLIQRGIKSYVRGHWSFYNDLIRKNRYLSELIKVNRKVLTIQTTVQIYSDQREIIGNQFIDLQKDEIFSWIILTGLLAYRIRPNSRKDYTNLIPSSLYSATGKKSSTNELFRV